MDEGATKVAVVADVGVSVPELPVASDQFTGRFAVRVTVPFTPAETADGVTTRPPLLTAALPVPVSTTTLGEPG
jgi:hypothetical protein